MTARSGPDKWITGEEARRFGHLLRAQNDAILIGIGTALADDPMLDCRLPGLEDRSPLRVVLDTHLRLPETAKLVRTAAKIPTLVFTASEGGEALRKHGVEIVNGRARRAGQALILARCCTRWRRAASRGC